MTRYICPMHPEMRGAEGDRCPTCNMFLVAEADATGAHSHHGHEGHHAAHAHAEHGTHAHAGHDCHTIHIHAGYAATLAQVPTRRRRRAP